MLEQAAIVYAANFTVDEMRQMEAFFRQPAGQKLVERWPGIAQQTSQIGQDVSRKAAEELRLRLTDALRQKGGKLNYPGGLKGAALIGKGLVFGTRTRNLSLESAMPTR